MLGKSWYRFTITTDSIYTTTQRHEGLPTRRKDNEDVPRRLNYTMLTKTLHIHQHQHIRTSNTTLAVFFQLRSRSAQKNFPFPRHEYIHNSHARRTHESLSLLEKTRESISKIFLTHTTTHLQDCNTVRAVRLNATTTSDQ